MCSTNNWDFMIRHCEMIQVLDSGDRAVSVITITAQLRYIFDVSLMQVTRNFLLFMELH